MSEATTPAPSPPITGTSPVALGDFTRLGALPGTSIQSKSSNPVVSFFNDIYTNISNKRQSLGLTNPGTVENITKELTYGTFLTNHSFTGLKADLNKMFSPNFQTSHSFALGSQFAPPYAFAALYGNESSLLQGQLASDGSLSSKIIYSWSKANISKVTLQIASASNFICQLEHEFNASDFSAHFRALNPSFLDGGFTGVATAAFLQSITSKLALGIETVYSKQASIAPADSATSYFARYNNGDWIASAQVHPTQGSITGSLWRKITDQVDAGIESKLTGGIKPVADPLTGGAIGYEPIVEGETTLGAKYEYHTAVFRGQIDNNGKVGAYLERRLTPAVAILFSGEIDHSKEAAKVGLGFQFEGAGSHKIFLMQNGLIDANGNPVPGAPQL